MRYDVIVKEKLVRNLLLSEPIKHFLELI